MPVIALHEGPGLDHDLSHTMDVVVVYASDSPP